MLLITENAQRGIESTKPPVPLECTGIGGTATSLALRSHPAMPVKWPLQRPQPQRTQQIRMLLRQINEN